MTLPKHKLIGVPSNRKHSIVQTYENDLNDHFEELKKKWNLWQGDMFDSEKRLAKLHYATPKIFSTTIVLHRQGLLCQILSGEERRTDHNDEQRMREETTSN
jgi:hypothetical protein